MVDADVARLAYRSGWRILGPERVDPATLTDGGPGDGRAGAVLTGDQLLLISGCRFCGGEPHL